MKKGIWYDAPRKRYRVRIYRFDQVIHLSYHSTYIEAEAVWSEAKRKKTRPVRALEVIGLAGQIAALDYM